MEGVSGVGRKKYEIPDVSGEGRIRHAHAGNKAEKEGKDDTKPRI
jgi:hypothetical protein